MLMKSEMQRTVKKVDELNAIYTQYLFRGEKVAVEIFVTDQFLSAPPAAPYKPIREGEEWGAPFHCGWFKLRFTTPAYLIGKPLYLFADSGATEHLVFERGLPIGATDYIHDGERPYFRLHKYLRVSECAEKNHEIYLEGYASHPSGMLSPYDDTLSFATTALKDTRTFKGIYIGQVDHDIKKLLTNLHFLSSLYAAHMGGYAEAEIENVYLGVFGALSRMPTDYQAAKDCAARANKILDGFFSWTADKPLSPSVSLVGHSHMDTVWLWDIDETKRKLARTAATALNMMERFPEYIFTMSSTLHFKWLKLHYPDLYQKIKKRIAEGRFEAVGGSYIECDANLTGGEAFVRQFLRGQKFLLQEFGKTSDVYWLPDTFGYTAALPQILKGCGIKYFMTTKINSNDTNRFPHDTFYWKGIDGSVVLTQFNIIHCYPDAATVHDRLNFVGDKNTVSSTLISYGFGDGGGGPNEDMIELARLSQSNKFLPSVRHCTVSEHMQNVEKNSAGIAVYDGELYFELHRGTFTTNGAIKKYNRLLEQKLYCAEILSVMKNVRNKRDTDTVYDELLLNQFHDILPGTSINEVNQNACGRYIRALEDIDKIIAQVGGGGQKLFNPLGWDIERKIQVPDERGFINLDGEKVSLKKLSVAAYGAADLSGAKALDGEFVFDGSSLTTPYYEAWFENGAIVRLKDRLCDRELVPESGRINAFKLYEDVPYNSDNWDIDGDYIYKPVDEADFRGSEVISNLGHFRLRTRYGLAGGGEILQDTVFYSDSRRIDFDTRIEWKMHHRLLKASFDLDIHANIYNSEIQFGYIGRNLKANNSYDIAKFETCNHKWTDISEPRYGAALINDCKYGISVCGNNLSLTLIKSGTHPDNTGDRGTHRFKYALMPHEGSLSVKSVIRPAYEFNMPSIYVADAGRSIIKGVNDNIVVETVKWAEEGDAVIIRLYEAEGCKSNLCLELDGRYKITRTDMLERDSMDTRTAECYERAVGPFEIVTLKLEKI